MVYCGFQSVAEVSEIYILMPSRRMATPWQSVGGPAYQVSFQFIYSIGHPAPCGSAFLDCPMWSHIWPIPHKAACLWHHLVGEMVFVSSMHSTTINCCPSDTNYGDASYGADFGRQGNLVTTSVDGFIRLYAARRYDSPIAKIKPSGINRPFSAVFSPDGGEIAVGDANTGVVVLSGKDLAFIRTADTTDVSEPGLSSVAWSIDGRYLFAGGRGNDSKIHRWENAGAGRHIDIDAAHETVMHESR